MSIELINLRQLELVPIAWVIVTLDFVLVLLFVEELRAETSSPRPNIVMILADDLCYRDLGFMGNREVHTPHLDQLATKSAVFPNGYVPMSVCRPSLATILTGLYPHQHGIHFNHPPPGLKAMRKLSPNGYLKQRQTAEYLIRRQPTLPRLLAKAGYDCLQTGKHWEGSFDVAGFTHGMTRGLPHPKDRYGTRPQGNGKVAHGNGDIGLSIGRETMQPIAEFLDQRDKDKPFFVWYAPFLPHTPFDAPDRFHKLYEHQQIPLHLKKYYAEVTRFDETVGKLLNLIAQHSSAERTLIVFASDNGYRPHVDHGTKSNAKADAKSKLSVFEDGLRTPVLFCWKGQIVPHNHASIVETVDLAPTLLAATRLEDEITNQMQGMNLLPGLRGKSTIPETPAFGAIYPNDATSLEHPERDVRARWIRERSYKLIIPSANEKRIPEALYDVINDPRESKNLLESTEHQNVVTRMRQRLDRWWTPHQSGRTNIRDTATPTRN